MNRGNDQGLGLLSKYIMLFFVCTVFFVVPVICFLLLQKNRCICSGFIGEVPSRFELENKGFADLRLTTWLWHLIKMER